MKLDDLAIPIMLIVVGALRVVPQLVYGGPWGAEVTVATAFMCLGLLALVWEFLRKPKGASPS